jgi:phosphoglycerate dehydrogenase-like enzyme
MPADQWEILLPGTIHPAGPESIAKFASFMSIDEYDDWDEFLADCDRFEAMIVRVTEISPDILNAADSLQVVAKHGAGLDNIDIPAASDHSVVVCNTPGANARSVAEHALMLILATRKRVVEADSTIRDGGWNRHQLENRELADDTLGLFGFGNIARELTDIVAGLDIELATFDPYVDEFEVPDAVEMVSATTTLFERSDIVSIHTPLTEQTRHAVGEAELTALGPNGTVVNTSRGGIVDEAALLKLLREGQLGSAGLDVFDQEPPADDDQLFNRDDIVLTPHMGGLTVEAMERMSQGAADNVRTVYEGGIPESTVNTDAFSKHQ